MPFRCVRAVSDTAAERLAAGFQSLPRRRRAFFARPHRAGRAGRPFTVIPGLLRLDRNCRLAAETLGEFLCRLPILATLSRQSPATSRQSRRCRPPCIEGASVVEVESVPVPEIGPGEILIRVEACGICHTDLKKIAYNLLAPPRIYGHETAGVVAAVGAGRHALRSRRPRDGLSPHSLRRMLLLPRASCTPSARCTRKSASRPDTSPPAADSRSTSA